MLRVTNTPHPPQLPMRPTPHQRDGRQDQPHPETTPTRPEITDRSPLCEVDL